MAKLETITINALITAGLLVLFVALVENLMNYFNI
jgi:hypothetical protein